MRYEGGCHCGKIRFSVDGNLEQVMECNCSLCTKRGTLHWFVPSTQFKLETPSSDLSTYTFNKHRIRHRFCGVCGCAPFAEGDDPKSGPMTAVNARCLEGIDLSTIARVPFDGRSL